MTKKKNPPKAAYQVGYRRPPLHTRFQKGQSGNPNGRPKRKPRKALYELMLEEAYRCLAVKDGNTIEKVPAIQIGLRATMMQIAKGNGVRLRDFIRWLPVAEQWAAAKEPSVDEIARNMGEIEVARRIAFALEKGARKLEAQRSGTTAPSRPDTDDS